MLNTEGKYTQLMNIFDKTKQWKAFKEDMEKQNEEIETQKEEIKKLNETIDILLLDSLEV